MDELFSTEPQVLTISELTRRVRGLLEKGIGEVTVSGEISNHRRQASGHHYFTLKDERAQLACVWFARTATRQKIEDGMAVLVKGEITVYEARGQYQLIVQSVQPQGQGALQARFEALKRVLDAEGLFDPARKRPLPRFPQAIGLVTSPTGAALQDMLTIFARRAPWVRLYLLPVKVQGEGAAQEIAAAIDQFQKNPPVDLLIIGRGGGSIEDLWPFNEEIVARAIARSILPVISAVGHETDFTIADFVADLRAPTPSAAAELATPDGADLLRRLQHLASRQQQHLRAAILHEKEKLQGRLAPALLRDTRRWLDTRQQTLDELSLALLSHLQSRLNALQTRCKDRLASLQSHRPDHLLALKKQRFLARHDLLFSTLQLQLRDRASRLDRLIGLLRVLGPDSTLQRGYTITTRPDGIVIQSKNIQSGDILHTRFQDGEIISTAQ